MNRPCFCGRALKGTDLDKFDASVPAAQKQCVACWNAVNDPDYQHLWELDEFGEPLLALEQKPLDRVRVDALAPKNTAGGCCPGETAAQ